MTALRIAPAYQQVAEAVRREILNGELKAGAQLPTELEFCSQFSASRITILRFAERSRSWSTNN
jgi:DNA-binding GntR family transcriptional regulator